MKKIKETKGDRTLQIITTIVLILVIIFVGYPVIYVISCSFSSTKALTAGKVLLWPVDMTVAGYKFVMQYKPVWIGYRNTIFYTFGGTLITIVLTILAAYPLSKKDYQGRKFFMTLFFITMLFHAGIVPTYIIKAKLGLINSIWAILLANSVNVSHLIILRTAFRSGIPNELFEAAKIDGASEFRCLINIAIPLAKATICVLILYAAVGCWNEYFNSMLYLRDQSKFPLQLFLRTILTSTQELDLTTVSSSGLAQQASEGIEQIKYALIVISTVPVLILYLIVQKSFNKGVLIGSLKG